MTSSHAHHLRDGRRSSAERLELVAAAEAHVEHAVSAADVEGFEREVDDAPVHAVQRAAHERLGDEAPRTT